jgi:putative DNA primase/helicase
MTLYSPTRAQLAAIPDQLKKRRQFVLWRGRDRANHPGKLDKIPMNPYDLEHASTTDALTWGTFDQCAAALETALEGWHAADPAGYRGGGIGYVFTTEDPYVGIDLDGCVNDVTWVIEAWAQEYVDTLKSYTEVTPSQTGLHILAEGSLPPGGRRKGAVEMYSEGRFFTLTGWHVDGTPETIERRPQPLQEMWTQLFGPKGNEPTEDTGTAASAPTPSMPDADILIKLSRAKNSDKFLDLWEGRWKELGYPSQSEADLALCGCIRFYTQNSPQIDRTFRQSKLMRPKWDEQRGEYETYGERTIRSALAGPHEHYTPPPILMVMPSLNGAHVHHPPILRPPPPIMPPLPKHVQCQASGVSSFLRDYIAHSKTWATRAAPGYHAAVAVWVLSAIAARRIVVHTGSKEVYPTLFIALVSGSTLWTKTTAAALGVRLIRRSGCGFLLSPDRATPQFLLKLMSGVVPDGYGQQPFDRQEEMKKAFGFAAQRGWFYEEWGGVLHQMRRADSPQAELNKLLIVLEEGNPQFSTGTIHRGLEQIDAPYLALLANATPQDLIPFMGEGDPWWQGGFWPRFICVTSPPDAEATLAPLPRTTYTEPSALVVKLHDWHTRLGMPDVEIEEGTRDNGRRTGRWQGTVSNFPRQVMEIDDEVYDAYEAYNLVLLEMFKSTNPDFFLSEDLRPWYGRAHEKALRIAMLLASVDGETVITLPYWQEAQALLEMWRESLHTLVARIEASSDMSPQGRRKAKIERRIEGLLALNGSMTARAMQKHLKGVASEELSSVLRSMTDIGNLVADKHGKKILYRIFPE